MRACPNADHPSPPERTAHRGPRAMRRPLGAARPRRPARVLSLLLLLAAACVAEAGGAAPVEAPGERLAGAMRLPLEAVALDEAAPARGAPGLAFTAGGRRYEIILTPADALLAALPAAQRPGAGVRLYRGRVVGLPGAWARVTVAGDRLHALVYDGRGYVALEPDPEAASAGPSAVGGGTLAPLVALSPAATALAFGADQRPSPGAVPATVARVAPVPSAATKALAAPAGKADLGMALRVVWLADAEFAARFGGAAQAELLARINVVDGIFSEQLGVRLQPSALVVYAAEPDPFTAGDPGELLDEVEALRFASPVWRESAVVHLLTGRDLAGGTVGIATVGTACDARFAVGLSEARRLASVDALIIAHELGHNFGAPHDGEAGTACASAPPGYLMAPSLADTDQFSDCSLAEMSARLATAACALPVTANDVALSADLPSALSLGATRTLGLLVDAPGAGGALDVDVELSVSEGLTLQAGQLAGGTCERPNADRLVCRLPALGEGASALLRTTVTATALGPQTLRARASAPGDPVPDNDALEAAIEVRPAADLGVLIDPAEVFAVPGRSREAVLRVSNAGPLVARDVQLRLAGDGAARILAVDGIDGCRPAADDGFECTLARLEAQDTVTATLTVSPSPAPVVDGLRRRESVSARITGSFDDPVPDNDESRLRLRVVGAIADLASELLAPGPTDVQLGREAEFRLRVANAGPDEAAGVSLDVLFALASVEVVQATAAGRDCAASVDGVRCEVATLAAGEALEANIVVRPLSGDRLLLNTRVASAEAADPASGNDAVSSELPVRAKAVHGGGTDAGGGGGALSPLGLGLLGVLVALRRRERAGQASAPPVGRP